MKKIMFLLVVSALVLAACRSSSESSDQPVELQISDAAKQLEAAVGNEFKIVINANPSTGYHWELVDELDESIVKFVSKEYRSKEDGIPGSGGVEVWVFEALAAGKTHITLGYYPPSNDPVEPQQTVTFTVTVK